LWRNIDAEQSEAGRCLTAGTDNAFAGSIFNKISLNTAQADSVCLVEVETFDGDSNAGEANSVLTFGALDYDWNTGAVISDLEERIIASETLSGGRIEGGAFIGNIEADIIKLILPICTLHSFMNARAVGKVIVDGVCAGLAIPCERVIVCTLGTDVEALPKVIVLSVGTSSVGLAAASGHIQLIPTDALETYLSCLIEGQTGKALLGLRVGAALGDAVVVHVGRVVGTGVGVSLPGGD
jgi:hypothetical protein